MTTARNEPTVSDNPFSPPVRDHFDAGLAAFEAGRTGEATRHLTEVAVRGNHRDRLLLADFLLAVRDTPR